MKTGLPKFESAGDRVIAFSLYADASVRERCVPFFAIVGFAAAICIPALLFGKVDLTGGLLISGFLVVLTLLTFEIIFSSWHYEFDGNGPEIRLTRRIYGRRPKKKKITVLPAYCLFILASSDDEGSEHVNVFIRKRWASYSLFRIPTASNSRQEITQFVEQIAKRLGIENRGYVSMWHYLWLLMTGRIWYF